MARPALAADRALQVIDLLVGHPTQRFTLTEIVRRTGINPASAHALLHVLLSGGYLHRHDTHKTYGLGPALIAAGTVARLQLPGVDEASRELDALSDELGLETVLTSPAGAHILVVAGSSHATEFGRGLPVGHRLPLNPPIGTVFLAFEPEAEVQAWLDRAHLPLGPTESARQRTALAAVRRNGYSVTLESPRQRDLGSALARREHDEDEDAPVEAALDELARVPYQLDVIEPSARYDPLMVAAPVFDPNGRAVAAISALGFASGVVGAELARVAEVLRGRAALITKRTHGRRPEPEPPSPPQSEPDAAPGRRARRRAETRR